MTTGAQARILLIDDDPERLRGLRILIEDLGAMTRALHPLELEGSDLEGADLISVDQYLGDDWAEYLISEDGPSSSATKATDGIAVAAAINSQLRSRSMSVAVTLHTAEIDRLGHGLPRAQREPLLAASYDLDWVFRFDGGAGAALAARITALSRAVAGLPDLLSTPNDFGAGWLGLPNKVAWAEFALEQIEDCRPPTHGLSANTFGRSAVRWLAQRVLPYPSFLVDIDYAATLLGVTKESLYPRLGLLEQFRYQGPLADFDGPRWWRAGLQDLLVAAGTDETESPSERVAALQREHESSLEVLALDQPVVAYDVDGQRLPAPVERRHALRLQPDGWPVFADDAWALREQVLVDPDLAALVVHSDRPEELTR